MVSILAYGFVINQEIKKREEKENKSRNCIDFILVFRNNKKEEKKQKDYKKKKKKTMDNH